MRLRGLLLIGIVAAQTCLGVSRGHAFPMIHVTEIGVVRGFENVVVTKRAVINKNISLVATFICLNGIKTVLVPIEPDVEMHWHRHIRENGQHVFNARANAIGSWGNRCALQNDICGYTGKASVVSGSLAEIFSNNGHGLIGVSKILYVASLNSKVSPQLSFFSIFGGLSLAGGGSGCLVGDFDGAPRLINAVDAATQYETRQSGIEDGCFSRSPAPFVLLFVILGSFSLGGIIIATKGIAPAIWRSSAARRSLPSLPPP
jgi:hypothetical protein